MSAFMLTASGAEYYLCGPASLIENPPRLADIAHHLAQINRFTGACSRPYSVAEHSLLTERIAAARGAGPGLRMAMLMHDAHEAYTSDLASPSKIAVGLGWTGFEAQHANNVRHFFGLRTAFAGFRGEIRRCDLIALATERRDLMPFDPATNAPWPVLDTPGAEVQPFDERLDPDEPTLAWRAMRDAFIHKYLMLRELVNAAAKQASAA